MKPSTIAKLIGVDPKMDYATAIKRHMDIVSDIEENPPRNPFRGELASEIQRRHYWQRKLGRRWMAWDFICAYPMLSKRVDFCFTSRAQAEREYFSKAGSEKRKANSKKYRWKKPAAQINLPVSRMVRVTILAGGDMEGRTGYVTALHPSKGFRVTIWPDERWKSKVRRWYDARDIAAVGEAKLPALPKVDE
ncbi:MAG: hypothetical protein AB7K41_15360 [Bdellovibrionales bacterium]